MKRSPSSIVIEKSFRVLGLKKKYCDKEKYKKYIENVIENQDKDDYKLPQFIIKSSIEEREYLSSKVYFINKNSDSKYLILYLHGGAYISHPLIPHLQFVDKLAKDLNAEIIFPLYPLLPKNTYQASFKLLDELYKDIIKDDRKIIFMGDSAGGGLALAFNEYLSINKQKVPNSLVLLSPWVDISLSNKNIQRYEDADPTLSRYGLREIGKLWAKDTDLKDYHVSPIYGNLLSVKESLIFVGTDEILYPDIKLLQEKLLSNNVKSKLVIGKEMNHDYVLYPIEEAKIAYNEIIEFINKE